MKIIIDTREQTPWNFAEQGFETERAKLDTGDYSLEGLEHLVCIERKSLDDWVGSIMQARTRFYKELDRMHAFDFKCVIIEAGIGQIMRHQYVSRASPNSVMGFIAEIVVGQSVPVYLGGTRAESQLLAGAFLKMASKKIRA